MRAIAQPVRVVAILVGVLLAGTAAPAAAQKATITELGGATSKAVIEVDAPPSEVYAVMTDYARWRDVLTDIKAVSVKSGGREKAKVWFRSRALKDKATVVFDNERDRVVRFALDDGPPGARSRGEYVLTALDGGKRTRITATLYLDVVGAAGWFIRGKTIRGRRQNKLRYDLEDIARHFR